MQVEQTEINGFQIENFNQHGLDVGKAQGICPLCSTDRKPENKKAICKILNPNPVGGSFGRS
jgi:hypothetical protein